MQRMENNRKREKGKWMHWEGPVEFWEETESEMKWLKEKWKLVRQLERKYRENSSFGKNMWEEWRRIEYQEWLCSTSRLVKRKEEGQEEHGLME